MLKTLGRPLVQRAKQQVKWCRFNSHVAATKSSKNFKIYALTSAFTLIGSVIGYNYATKSQNSDLKSTTPLKDVPRFKYSEGAALKKGFEEIENFIGKDNFTRTPSELDYHSDSYFNVHKPGPDEKPKLIVYAKTTEEVSEVMKICYRYKIPIVPFTGGTSLEGNYISTRPGVVIDLSRMDKIIQFNPTDLDIHVEAGVGWQDLDEYLKPHGLLFGPDPGPGAKIGGMVATSCSGTQAFRYGTMKEAVLNLTVVLADGTIIKTKQRSKKSAAGYNLTGLFIGAEGTLGIVTEATLKLHQRPNEESVIVANFETVKEATEAVEDILIAGTSLNAIELLDSNMMRCINHMGQTTKKWVNKPTLLFKVGGATKTILNENIKLVKNISKSHNLQDFQFATSEEEKFELWQARKLALFSTIDYGKELLGQNAKVWVTDVAVPISKLSELIEYTRKDFDTHSQGKTFFTTFLGHVGDGNFHAVVLYDPKDTKLVEELTSRMVFKALELEGTCTGEHGVGMGKRHFLIKEVGEKSIDLMRHLKLSLDPYGLLNTDKVFKMEDNKNSIHH